MSIYSRYILPKFLDRSMRSLGCNGTRSDIASKAKGVVLEIGFGSGYNMPFYNGVTKLYALEPYTELYKLAKERIANASFPLEYLQDSAEKIPLPDKSVDSVVSTWVLCSIPDPHKALLEIVRVLKPGGRFIFVEHGQSPKTINSVIQKLITPVTRLFTGNCHLDRKMDDLIKNSGLILENIQMFPEKGRPLMFSYRGVAGKTP